MNVDQVRHLGEIQTRDESATEGPWQHGFSDGSGAVGDNDEGGWIIRPPGVVSPTDKGATVILRGGRDDWGVPFGVERSGDAEFIAHAREDIPWLLALVDDLVAENGRLQRGCAGITAEGADLATDLHGKLAAERALNAQLREQIEDLSRGPR